MSLSSAVASATRKIIRYASPIAGLKQSNADKVKVLSAGDGDCRCEMTITADDVNPMGVLHGGVSSTIVDVVSVAAMLSDSSFSGNPGVTVNLNMTFMAAAKIGEEIVIDAQTLKMGKSMAFLAVEIRNKSNGQLVVQGSHSRFIGSNSASS